MPAIVEPTAVREVYQEAAERRVSLANICPEDRRSLEATLRAAWEFGGQIGVPDLPIIISFTGSYPDRPQLRLMTTSRELVLGFELMLSDIAVFMSDDSPYRRLRVLIHLDHGQPEADAELLEKRADRLSTVMYDCSTLPFDQNIEKTRRYVERMRGRVLVEGAVDEIYEAGSGRQKNEPTTVEQATRFIRETGCFLIVPNLGTEHRASTSEKRYRGDRAREIAHALGRVIVLHGTSSLSLDELANLKEDGIIKVNVWTAITRDAGQALAKHILQDLGNYFDETELRSLQMQGHLGDLYFRRDYVERECKGRLGPKLASFSEPPRRDAWVAAAVQRIRFYMERFGYERYAHK